MIKYFVVFNRATPHKLVSTCRAKLFNCSDFILLAVAIKCGNKRLMTPYIHIMGWCRFKIMCSTSCCVFVEIYWNWTTREGIVVSHHMIRNTYSYCTLWLNKILLEEDTAQKRAGERKKMKNACNERCQPVLYHNNYIVRSLNHRIPSNLIIGKIFICQFSFAHSYFLRLTITAAKTWTTKKNFLRDNNCEYRGPRLRIALATHNLLIIFNVITYFIHTVRMHAAAVFSTHNDSFPPSEFAVTSFATTRIH